jgi:cytosine/adenosine deaminase-related metal-dependent hydrolase
MIKHKRSWSEEDFQESWLSGYKSVIETGTTLIADTLSHPSRFSPPDLPLGPKLFPFYEFIHLQGTPLDESNLAMAAQHAAIFEKLPVGNAGISPHAPYTTTTELWESLRNHTILGNFPMSVHLSESTEEFDLFNRNTGPMHDWFDSIQHLPKWGTGSPVQLMDEAGILKKGGIAVHVNCLGEGDAERLARNDMFM